MSLDTWLTQGCDQGWEIEVKQEKDVSKKNYICEIDPCMNKAIKEITIGRVQDNGGQTYLVCEDHDGEFIEQRFVRDYENS